MLNVNNLFVSYNGHPIIQGLNLVLQPGRSLAVVGESGTGKSTLAFALMGLVRERADHGRTEGVIELNGNDINALTSEERRQVRWSSVALVFQDADDALNPVYRVSDQVREPLVTNEGIERAEADTAVDEMFAYFGLPEDRRKAYPHELSIGERQKVLLAMAFICNPDLVILDEPVSALDALSRSFVTERLRELFRDRMALVITHDLGTASSLTDDTAFLYAGTVVESGPSAHVFDSPRHPYARGLVRSFPDMRRTKDLQGIKGRAEFPAQGCPFHPRCTQSIEVCGKVKPELQENDGRCIACHRGGIIPLLELQNLSTTLGDTAIVQDVSLSLYEGETLVIAGESGAGKTTLAKTILGLVPSTAGQIRLEGNPVQHNDPAFCRRVQMIFQNPSEAISHRFTVFQAVKEPLDIQKTGTPQERYDRVIQALQDAELPTDDAFLHRYPHELSGGEKQRVVIARALVLEPEVLIADEPTSSLDASVQAKILKLLNSIQEKRGLSMLLITHNLALARKTADRMAIMHKGSIIESERADTLLRTPQQAYTRHLIGAADKL